MIKKINYITREFIRRNPDCYFIFGDNLKGTGFGGQAKECRGEPNTIGIPTKKRPSTELTAYFSDSDFESVVRILDDIFNVIETLLQENKTVYYPSNGIGTGLAKLPTVSPKIHAYIEHKVNNLFEKYGENHVK